MQWLLIIYAISYGFNTVPVMDRFDTEEQCEIIGKHITDTHGNYRGYECVDLKGLPKDSK